MKTVRFLLVALVSFGLAHAAPAEKLAVGSTVPAFALEDSKGKKQVLDEGVRRIYATASRDADGFMEKALKKDGQEKLDAQGAVVLADISGAPFFIKGFIRDSLEERSYLTWIDEEGEVSGVIPHRDDQVTILELDRRRVTAIRHAKDLKELRAELAPQAVTPTAPVEPAAPAGNEDQQEDANADL